MTLEVVVLERLLDVRRIERRELCALPPGRAGGPGAIDVEAQRHMRADRLAYRAGERDVGDLVVADLQLERGEAAALEFARILRHPGRIKVARPAFK
jgi:hypothetical protein